MKQIIKKIQSLAYENTIANTAMWPCIAPIRSLIEKSLLGISNTQSIQSRFKGIGLGYLGLASLIKLRDYSAQKLEITDRYKKYHDMALGTFLTLGVAVPVNIGVYYSCGIDIKKSFMATGLSIISMGCVSWPIGWCADVYRDIFNIKKSNRTPNWLKNSSKKLKYSFVAGVTITSITAMACVYNCVPGSMLPRQNNYRGPTQIEQIIRKTYDLESITYSDPHSLIFNKYNPTR